MKRFVHSDIFRYQDTPTEGESPSTHPHEGFSTLTVPTSKIEFADNSIAEKKEERSPSTAGTRIGKIEESVAAAGNANNRSTRGYPRDVNEFCDDLWYYSTAAEGYFSIDYTNDQEVFVEHLSAQVTENELRFLLFSFVDRFVRL